jgi:poly-gamma-glutamate synthesis protein (capsule biosynthesis protein)
VKRDLVDTDLAKNGSDSSIRILFGGDVNFSWDSRRSPYVGIYHKKSSDKRNLRWIWDKLRRKLRRRLYRIFPSWRRKDILRELASVELLVKQPENETRAELKPICKSLAVLDLDRPPTASTFAYPFQKIAPLLKQKDSVMVNLETPLADDQARVFGMFRSHPGYAGAMANAGITIVSLANNHIFDALEVGLFQTVEHLQEAGISLTGYGRNFEEARLGKMVEIKGARFVFLAYTQYCNTRYASIAGECPGTLPLDPELVVEDISRAKDRGDFVVVTPHWGIEDQPHVQRRLVTLAHSFVDAGADAIIGHHPHVPHGIEIYHGRPILYSLGNFVFGRYQTGWSDNYLAELVIKEMCVREVILYPISGHGKDLGQPRLLTGASAKSLLTDLREKSAVFGTQIDIVEDIGYIRMR